MNDNAKFLQQLRETSCKKHGYWSFNTIEKECPFCLRENIHDFIIKYLINNCIGFYSHCPFYFNKHRIGANVDFYFEENNKAYIILCNGIQHYSVMNCKEECLEYNKENDEELKQFCDYNNITYIEIKYNDKEELIKKSLDNIIFNKYE